ncbi:hypothetical protein DRN67_01350 [Candidatus Micrarchaeota archaeon]|nr:MAG: hypothetical protein DRN67_01350 [Candidatus Micrarchaeota archaeon]
MIAKPEWFAPRKFGWGLGIRTKEGWLYILSAFALIFAAAMLPYPEQYRPFAMGAVILFFLLDALSVMPKVYAKLDERERLHQLTAERNATFAAVVVLGGSILYYSTLPALGNETNKGVLVVCALTLLSMALAKGLTLMRMEHEESA